MGIVLLMILGFVCGGVCVWFIYEIRRRRVAELHEILQQQQTAQNHREKQLNERAVLVRSTELTLNRAIAQFETTKTMNELALTRAIAQFETTKAMFDKNIISYQDLLQENKIIKTDLRNTATHLAKQAYEERLTQERQQQIANRVNLTSSKYLLDCQKWLSRSITPNNYTTSRTKLLETIQDCRDIGVTVDPTQEAGLLQQLKQQYELAVRSALEREEQARIRTQIREEQRREKEAQTAIEQAEREKTIIEAALAKALAEATDKHSLEIQNLQTELDEAIAKSLRAISQAQLTKSGHVYVISNIGSFGEGIFKIGMTRRLEPLERINELGSASVPFLFDVHMMIASDNAPALENSLHKAFRKCQVNKVNPRKEFFRTTIQEIANVVQEAHGVVQYIADAEALAFRESLKMTPEDQDAIEEVYENSSSSPEAEED